MVVPVSDISISQYQKKKTCDADNIPHAGVRLEVQETNNQAFVVVPTSDVSISQYQPKEYVTLTTYLVRVIFWRCQRLVTRCLRWFLCQMSV